MSNAVYTLTSPEVFDPWLFRSHWDVKQANATPPAWATPTLATLQYSFPSGSSILPAFDNETQFNGLQSTPVDVRLAVDWAFAEVDGFTDISIVNSNSTAAPIQVAMDPSILGGYAYLPGDYQLAGNIGLGTLVTNPVPGNEAYLIVIHEIGHALGLEHGHEFPEFVASGFDSQEYTVVTYTDYVGDTDTYFFGTGEIDWPQSFMQLDIAALQFLYGANYASSGEVWSGNTIYSFNSATGEMSINGQGQGAPAGNRIFRTIWDGHGNDTYDLSNYATNLRVDLTPGAFSTFSEAQLADLDRFSSSPDRIAAGNVANARLVEGDTRALIENVIGGSGHDTIVGNQAANRLQGSAGNDVIDGGDGDDSVFGGMGDDHLDGSGDNDKLYGGEGRDHLLGGAGNDTLIGENGDDLLLAGNGSDVLSGDNGNDHLSGHQDRDHLYGGAGDDTVLGGDGDDVLYGGIGFDVLSGDNGNDHLIGREDRDHLYGGTGDDTVLGGDGDDVLYGGIGFDVLSGDNGNDHLIGRQDRDHLYGGAGDDTMLGGDGDDVLFGGIGLDVLSGDDGNDRLVGRQDHDLLYGGAGDDTVLGGDGDDLLFGGFGLDVLSGDIGNDHLSGREDDDFLYGGAGDDTVLGGDGDDVLFGGLGLDLLSGGNGNDHLVGRQGQDTLQGGAGDDTLDGGDGSDQLHGGTGVDRFLFRSVSDSSSATGIDGIDDFVSGVDVIDLSGLFEGSAIFASGGDFSPGVASVRVVLQGQNTVVEADLDGDGSVDFELEVLNVSKLSEGDFLL